jgi:nitrate/TMAO reductase-like tetraheme cytochrome c subunit
MSKRSIFRLSYLVIFLSTLAILFVFNYIDTATTGSGYCLSCHEMDSAVGDAWKNSRHFANALGMRTECSECHVNPGVIGFATTKAWPAIRDHYVHFLGNADPSRMDWERLRERARMTISEDACKRCHTGLTGSLVSKAAMAAHLAAQQSGEEKYRNCLTCHFEPMHPAIPAWGVAAGFDRKFSRIEVAKHNQADDFFVIIEDGVYDVTEYRKYHSGGNWCFVAGEDNTAVCLTCHAGPQGADKANYLDSYGIAQDYPQLAYKAPKMRVGTLVDTAHPYSQYFVEPMGLKPLKPVLDRYGIVDDLGITERFVVSKRGALHERVEKNSSIR